MQHIERVVDGHVVKFDDDFLEEFCSKTWHVTKNKNVFYVRHSQTMMHRAVLSAKSGQMVDHINGDGLDNRKINLRFITHQGNKANSLDVRATSRFIGVSKHRRKFRASAKSSGKIIHIGSFEIESDAAKAYDKFAHQKYGEAAILNFPFPKI